MFWGEGDTSRLGPSERKTLEELRRMAETGHIRALSPKESEVALQAINFYATIQSTMAFASGLRNILLLVGGLIAIWWAMQEGLLEMLQKALSTGTGA